MRNPSLCIAVLAATLLCRHPYRGIGSVQAEDTHPVAADLVHLALAIPEATTEIEDANQQLPFLLRQAKKGLVPQSEVDDYRRQLKTATRKLELLGFVIDAEIKATEYRVDYFESFMDAPLPANRGDAALGRTQAEARLRVLTLFKAACTNQEANQDDDISLRGDLPPLEPELCSSIGDSITSSN